MAEPENHTLALLREMRAEAKAARDEANARLDAVDASFEQLPRRLDSMHANGVKALSQFVGHRAMVERTMASFQNEEAELKRRVDALEAAQA